MNGGTVFAIIVMILLLVGIPVALTYWWVSVDQKFIDKGCTALTWNQYGLGTTWSCPHETK